MATVSVEIVRWNERGNPRIVVFDAILVGFAARFWLKRTDHDLSSFLVAITLDFMDASAITVWMTVLSTLSRDLSCQWAQP